MSTLPTPQELLGKHIHKNLDELERLNVELPNGTYSLRWIAERYVSPSWNDLNKEERTNALLKFSRERVESTSDSTKKEDEDGRSRAWDLSLELDDARAERDRLEGECRKTSGLNLKANREFLKEAEEKVAHLENQLSEVDRSSPSPGQKTPHAQTGVPKAAIIGAFEPPGNFTAQTWEKALGDAKRITWLRPARIDSGTRGVSASWNPAQLAMCICDHFKVSKPKRKRYGDAIQKQFPDWLDEWERYAASFDD